LKKSFEGIRSPCHFGLGVINASDFNAPYISVPDQNAPRALRREFFNTIDRNRNSRSGVRNGNKQTFVHGVPTAAVAPMADLIKARRVISALIATG
jgi:hypothetical protein